MAVGEGMNWEIGIDMYTLICIKLMTNENLLYKKINKIKFKNSEKKSQYHTRKKKIVCLLEHLKCVLLILTETGLLQGPAEIGKNKANGIHGIL